MPDKKSRKRLDGCERDGAIGVQRERGVMRQHDTQSSRMAAIPAQLDRIPDRADAFDPLVWDEHGLPV